uniref:Uncharacterized protein n=1 Tax=Oryza punctata TaxID=4537 RepID=A0A0E0LTN5_ORYPU
MTGSAGAAVGIGRVATEAANGSTGPVADELVGASSWSWRRRRRMPPWPSTVDELATMLDCLRPPTVALRISVDGCSHCDVGLVEALGKLELAAMKDDADGTPLQKERRMPPPAYFACNNPKI